MRQRRNPVIFTLFFGWLLAWAPPSVAQEHAAETGQNVGYEMGFLLGNLLPNQIGGVTEITGVGGVRAGFRTSHAGFAETTFVTGNGNGVQWKNLGISLRMDLPVETLVGFVYGGADVAYYKGATSISNRMIFGGHVGGGLQAQVGGDVWFRADMKFGVSPGTYLMINGGFLFRLPEGGAGGPE